MSTFKPLVAVVVVAVLNGCGGRHESQYPTSLGKTSPSSPMGGSGRDARDTEPQQHDTALPIPNDPLPRGEY